MDHNQEVRDGQGRRPRPRGFSSIDVSPAVTEKVKQGLSRSGGEGLRGAKVAAGLRQLLASNDFVQMWTKGAAPDGMRPNDLGDSLAEYWTTNWAYASGLSATTPAQTKAIRFQLGPTIARNPQVRRMSDAQKQAFSETLMLNLVVEVIGMEAGRRKHDPAVLQKIRTQTAARFKQEFGVDLMELKLTRRGFVRA